MHGSIHDSNFKQVAGHVEPGRTELFPISKGKKCLVDYTYAYITISLNTNTKFKIRIERLI